MAKPFQVTCKNFRPELTPVPMCVFVVHEDYPGVKLLLSHLQFSGAEVQLQGLYQYASVESNCPPIETFA
ncbi:hypothetical protein AV530_014531 [Patagioenas fasciata monilis]|uniref:Uncharacterized protein n=1 Tax=Patagioenas fasciata monilis TaxID=372326 RepID=A0A1V4KC27_PATFA|nr:hypothetical protein AV530_014531 [Patagioenas fasciata monilis]